METQGLAPMSDGTRLHWAALRGTARRTPVVMLHGGPGLPDYLGEIAPMVADLAPVYRYDQRGTGRSPWEGRHSLARHVDDLAGLLDAWNAPDAVLIGHSYGTDLASRFCLKHPHTGLVHRPRRPRTRLGLGRAGRPAPPSGQLGDEP
ncbi:alpha/beta fold hydrolase [Streptomyces sp. NPDC046465]|uniref:alpha/beta fold hydrolase n=1 Tax=Streptomyces sp. NPDC046465 TaxID=3155810 RepID=UPI003401D2BB